MSNKPVIRRLLVTALVVAMLAPAGALFADAGGDAADVDGPVGALQEVIDWLIGLVDATQSNPTDGDNGPTVDPAG